MKLSDDYSRRFLFLTLILYIVMGYGTRLLWKWFVCHHRLPVVRPRRILALLDLENADQSLESLNRSSVKNFIITGIISIEQCDMETINGVPVVASLKEAASYICQGAVDSIYVGCSITDQRVTDFLDICIQMAIPIHYHMSSLCGDGMKYCVESIGDSKVLTSSINYSTARERIAKRFLDIVIGIFGSIMALMIMMVLGPWIKRVSPGPILYKQERVGLNGRLFKMYKIRSMCLDADKKKKELMEQNKIKNNKMFKMENDPRVIGNEILPNGTVKTGIGEFIRKTSLDEFPQFFNVLMGQMSLVGTRPPTVDEWENYEYHHRARLACKPGITGLWQVSGRSEITDFEEVVRLDIQYITNWSFGMDLRILLKTFRVVLVGKGAY